MQFCFYHGLNIKRRWKMSSYHLTNSEDFLTEQILDFDVVCLFK